MATSLAKKMDDLAIFLAVIFGFLFCVSFWGFVIWKVFKAILTIWLWKLVARLYLRLTGNMYSSDRPKLDELRRAVK